MSEEWRWQLVSLQSTDGNEEPENKIFVNRDWENASHIVKNTNPFGGSAVKLKKCRTLYGGSCPPVSPPTFIHPIFVYIYLFKFCWLFRTGHSYTLHRFILSYTEYEIFIRNSQFCPQFRTVHFIKNLIKVKYYPT
jgi:hypothetical protein